MFADMRAPPRRTEAPEAGASPKSAVKAGDALFRAFGQHAAWVEDLVRSVLPASRRGMKLELRGAASDPNRVKGNLEQRFGDLLWLAETDLGRDMMLLFEHQSTVDEAMMLRLQEYRDLALRWYREQHPGRPDPIILQTVVYTGREPWRATLEPAGPQRLEQLLQGAADMFCYALVGLVGAGEARMHRHAPKPAARAWLRLLAWHPAQSGWALVDIFRDLPDTGSAREMAVCYIAAKKNVRPGLGDWAWGTAKPHMRRTRPMATIAVEYTAKGKAEGKAETLQRLLEHRFGALPEPARMQIERASLDQLDAWFDAALEADSVEAALENGANGSGKSNGSNGADGQNGAGGAAR